MNFRLFLCFSLLCGIGFTSCDNEIDLVSDWKSIPVVYALINAQDTAHYIRVEKAFLDPNKSGTDLAQIPDSLYYDNIQVQIERTGNTNDTYTLTRVDGNKEGYVRDQGIFADSPNWLYKLKLPANEKLQGQDLIKLVLNIGDSQQVTAETVVTSPYELTGPSPIITPQTPVRSVGFLPENAASTKWRDDAGTSNIFDITYYIHYRERPNDSSPFENKILQWDIADGFIEQGSSSSTIRFDFESIEFYQILNANLVADGFITRRLDSINVEIIGAGEELVSYREIGLANTGITSSQVIPTFTNLSEGRGIFTSSTYMLETGFKVSDRTLDSLQVNTFTRDLNFQ